MNVTHRIIFLYLSDRVKRLRDFFNINPRVLKSLGGSRLGCYKIGEVKVEIPSNFSQVVSACLSQPPQTMLLHMLCPDLAMFRLPTEQLRLVLGWNISADIN